MAKSGPDHMHNTEINAMWDQVMHSQGDLKGVAACTMSIQPLV